MVDAETAAHDGEDDYEPHEWTEEETAALVVALPDDILYKLLQDKLKENACRNRGYVLDGYPKTYENAEHSFLELPAKYDEEGELIEPEEPELEEGEKKDFSEYIPDKKIFPKSCILLTGSDESLIARVRELPEEALEGTRYNMEEMNKRIVKYREANNSVIAEPSVQKFFEDREVSVFTESMDTAVSQAFDSFEIFIERNEKPYNYMTWDAEEEVKRAGNIQT